MREIKFRAWYAPKASDEWEKITLPKMIYFDDIGYCDEYNHLSFSLSKKSRDPDGGDYCNLCARFEDFSSLMQYTGLKDKNGKDIYEGDIIKWRDEILEVKWAVVGWTLFSRFFSKFGRPNGDDCGEINTIGYTLKSEVIGNIYENPELLKV